MDSRRVFGGLIVLVGFTVVGSGCAQFGARPNGQLIGRRSRPDSPPEPAPALFIPNQQAPVGTAAAPTAAAPTAAAPTAAAPTAAAPTGVVQASATTISPQQPENLPLRASQPPGSTSPGTVPPLYPVPPAADSANPMAHMRELYQKAAEKHASMDSYVLRLRRREVVGTQSRPEEILLMKWRREPWSIYLKWQGPEGKGREVVYVKGRYEDKLHTLTAAGDIPLLPAGKRFSLAPDGPLVRSKSRYPITEAGLGSMIERYGRLIAAVDKGDMRQGTVKYLGLVKRDDYDKQLEGVLQTLPPGSDPHLPRGGIRLWLFDPTLHLPMLLIAKDETNREVEYYCHDRFMYPVHLTDDDFNPDVLWKSTATH